MQDTPPVETITQGTLVKTLSVAGDAKESVVSAWLDSLPLDPPWRKRDGVWLAGQKARMLQDRAKLKATLAEFAAAQEPDLAEAY